MLLDLQEPAEWRDLNAARVVREYRNGEGFLYLGRSYRLLLVADQEQPLLLKGGRFRLRRDLVHRGAARSGCLPRQFADRRHPYNDRRRTQLPGLE